MRSVALIVGILTLSCIACSKLQAQKIYINDYYNVYEGEGPVGSCQYKALGNFGISLMLSIAVHNDTLYVINEDGELYQVDLNTYFTRDLGNMNTGYESSYIAMTCDKAGKLYMVDVDFSVLVQYDPYKDIKTATKFTLSADGDLLFFRDTLLYSCNGPYIYALDLTDLSASKPWMTTGANFYGLCAAPGDCHRNRLFGVTGDGRIIELDPDQRKVIGQVCQLDIGAMDAASDLDDGNLAGIKIDSLALLPSCKSAGSVTVFASPGPGVSVTYMLDGTLSSSSGNFSGINNGTHTIEITTTAGCQVDSVFSLVLKTPNFAVDIVKPQDCALNNGSLTIFPADPAASLQYALNGGQTQPNPTFTRLGGGQELLSVFYGAGCEKDTTVFIDYLHATPYPATLKIAPTLCSAHTGSLMVTPLNLAAGTLSAALNSGAPQNNLLFPSLDSGRYMLHVMMANGCRFDSVITVAELVNPAPLLSAAITNQICLEKDGGIALSIMGNDGPYQTSLNSAAFTDHPMYDELAPSLYNVAIRDADGCVYDTSFTIRPYTQMPVTLEIDSADPVCTSLSNGSFTVAINGGQPPYQFGWNNGYYTNGNTVSGLTYGDYTIFIQNKDGCIVDTVHKHLDLVVLPECSKVYVPSAFSPNGDGNNDKFVAIHDAYLSDVQLQVYNRYGGLVFSSGDGGDAWDGTYHGSPQPAGTYIWKVSYKDHDNIERTMRGTVLVIR